MANHQKEDVVEKAGQVTFEVHAFAVLAHSDWVNILNGLPAKVTVELRDVSIERGTGVMVPISLWIMLMDLLELRETRH